MDEDRPVKYHSLYDISDASREDIKKLKEMFLQAAHEMLAIANEIVDRGELHGCPHTHLEMAMKEYIDKFPCDNCAIEIPPKGECH